MKLKKDKIKKQALEITKHRRLYEKMHAFLTMCGIKHCHALINRMGGPTCSFSERLALFRNIFSFNTRYLGEKEGLVTIKVRPNVPIIPAFNETLNNIIAIAPSHVLLIRGDESLAVCPGSASCC